MHKDFEDCRGLAQRFLDIRIVHDPYFVPFFIKIVKE